jgi:hypothetical protein
VVAVPVERAVTRPCRDRDQRQGEDQSAHSDASSRAMTGNAARPAKPAA